jgi:hypothetical protein
MEEGYGRSHGWALEKLFCTCREEDDDGVAEGEEKQLQIECDFERVKTCNITSNWKALNKI